MNWEKEGLIHPVKTPKGTRRYLQTELKQVLGFMGNDSEKIREEIVLYARVSTKKQQLYLKNQEERLKAFAGSLKKPYVLISEIASGMGVVA